MSMNIDRPEPTMLDALYQLPSEHPVLLVTFMGLVGLCVGSFANVAVYRMPRYCLSLIRPGSHCPKCETPIKWHDNIPVFAWALWLRGKCRACKAPIHWRYPAVELLMGAIFALLAFCVLVLPLQQLAEAEQARWVLLDNALKSGANLDFSVLEHTQPVLDQWRSGVITEGKLWALFGLWAFGASALVIASLIDLEFQIIPDRISIGCTAIVWLLAPLVPAVHHIGVPPELFFLHGPDAKGVFFEDPVMFPRDWPEWLRTWANTSACMLIAAFGLWLIGTIGTRLFRKEAERSGGAMGLGDVKFVMLIAGLLGFHKMLAALAVAVAAGALMGLPVIFRKLFMKSGETTARPFGPYLSLGCIVCMLAAGPLFDGLLWYMKLIRSGQ